MDPLDLAVKHSDHSANMEHRSFQKADLAAALAADGWTITVVDPDELPHEASWCEETWRLSHPRLPPDDPLYVVFVFDQLWGTWPPQSVDSIKVTRSLLSYTDDIGEFSFGGIKQRWRPTKGEVRRCLRDYLDHPGAADGA